MCALNNLEECGKPEKKLKKQACANENDIFCQYSKLYDNCFVVLFIIAVILVYLFE